MSSINVKQERRKRRNGRKEDREAKQKGGNTRGGK